MRTAHIYARVSKEEDSQKDVRYQEPENQLEPLRSWTGHLQYDEVYEYVDRGSGADPNRKDFKRLLDEVQPGDDILIWKLDRFSREAMSTVVGRIQTLQRRGIAIKSYTETWLDTSKDNPMSELVLAIMSWAAAEERRKISERTKAGIQRLRNIGAWKGGRPKKRDPPVSLENKTGLKKTDVSLKVQAKRM